MGFRMGPTELHAREDIVRDSVADLTSAMKREAARTRKAVDEAEAAVKWARGEIARLRVENTDLRIEVNYLANRLEDCKMHGAAS